MLTWIISATTYIMYVPQLYFMDCFTLRLSSVELRDDAIIFYKLLELIANAPTDDLLTSKQEVPKVK